MKDFDAANAADQKKVAENIRFVRESAASRTAKKFERYIANLG
jgi:hypothetical protein